MVTKKLKVRRTRRQIPDVSNPVDRPLRGVGRADLLAQFEAALTSSAGAAGAHCVHELWMRGEIGLNVEAMLTRLWRDAAASVPEWLPMRFVDWLPTVYDVAARFRAAARGRHNVYLVLLDHADSRTGPYGIYVGMSHYAPAERFDQHKAGIRAAGSVLRRGLEVLTGPALHLQRIARADAVRIEEQLAEALRTEGLRVQGGH
ncbi:MAG TPA: hypothetical protein VFI92_03665 [Steroidobacteraceae bacterium]|nr:hypothetical protein [Steroidobacteraceae bacterium]